MEKEIVYTDKYALILSDEKIKEGDWIFEKAGRLGPFCFSGSKANFHMKKIIAHLPLSDAPILEGLPLLEKLPQVMKKQTAVEWLEEQINLGLSERGLISAIKQAKQMEKEQIKDAWYDGISGGQCGTSEEYYNETYGETKN
jgi:hypothetical protein